MAATKTMSCAACGCTRRRVLVYQGKPCTRCGHVHGQDPEETRRLNREAAQAQIRANRLARGLPVGKEEK